MAEWMRERAALLETIRRQEQDAAKLATRFKLLQKTLVEQQKLLDRYQKALLESGCDLMPSCRPTKHASRTGSTDPITLTSDAHHNATAPHTSQSAETTLSVHDRSGQEEEKEDHNDRPSASRKRGSESVADDLPVGGKRVPVSSGTSGDASWISRKTDFHRGSSDPKKAVSSSAAEIPGRPSATTITPGTSNTNSTNAASVREKKPSERALTWAQEKQRMRDAGILTSGSRFTDKAPSRAKGKAPSSSSQSSEENEGFQYVEVVRNRDARAALPGHDCVECRKYYEALDGLIPDADLQMQKAKCSRHRARFEPYNTPDDFWRLSFPDSESPPLSP